MVAVLAGRRVDAADASAARFPMQNVEKVKEKLKHFFIANSINYLVCSGACGADLIALDIAGQLNISRKIVLPFDAETFRSSSVTDRPGNWGKLFDTVYKELNAGPNVIVLNYGKDDNDAYEKTNFDILNTADLIFEKLKKAGDGKKVAVIIWEGAPKDSNDTTDHFRKEAEKRGYTIEEINCLH
ncbi:MAG TPA: hypothetical protein VGP55_15555 [Chitinophagaceae bacterium]|nr:hypothetical protein [Chitinophagaceae bacterium]